LLPSPSFLRSKGQLSEALAKVLSAEVTEKVNENSEKKQPLQLIRWSVFSVGEMVLQKAHLIYASVTYLLIIL